MEIGSLPPVNNRAAIGCGPSEGRAYLRLAKDPDGDLRFSLLASPASRLLVIWCMDWSAPAPSLWNGLSRMPVRCAIAGPKPWWLERKFEMDAGRLRCSTSFSRVLPSVRART